MAGVKIEDATLLQTIDGNVSIPVQQQGGNTAERITTEQMRQYVADNTNVSEFQGAGDYARVSDIPTKTSELQNDSGFLTSESDPVFSASPAAGITAQDISDWNAKSDFSGSYDDLTHKPTIPTKTSQLQNDGADNTSTYVEHNELANVATSGNYNDLNGKPTIPSTANCYETTDANENDIDDSDKVPFYDTSATGKRSTLWSNIKSKLKAYFDNYYITSHQDISGKADKVSSATNGDLAGLDSNGNLTDSGLTATSVSGAVADAHTHSNKAMLDLVPSSLGTAGQALCTNTNADGTEWKTIGGGGGSVNWSQIGSYTPAFGNLEDAAQNTLIPLSLKPIVTENSQTPILALNDGYLYVCGEVTSLDFTLNPPQSNDYVAEYHLFFTSGATPTTINWAGGLRFTDGNTPTIESGKTYEINIINNCVLIQSYV